MPNVGGGVSIVRIVCLFSCRWTEVNTTVRTWTTESTCFCICVCICIRVVYNIQSLLYNYWMIFFYINHFSLIIFYHSVLVGLWTIRLLVQVNTHWVQFTLACRGHDNHKCHNKNPRYEMGLGCEWRHARKRWAENLVISKKQLVEIWLWVGPVQLSWGFDCGRCRNSQHSKKLCLSLSSCRKN